MTKCRSHDRLGPNAGVDSTIYHLTITAATGKQISQLSLTQSAITLPTNQWLKASTSPPSAPSKGVTSEKFIIQ